MCLSATEIKQYSFIHLPQDIFFEILAFSHGNTLSGTYSQSTVSQLFNTMIYVSKECHQKCISYAQTIPIQIPSVLNKKNLIIDWMCTNRIMIGDIFCSFFKPIMASNYLRIIRECNLAKLTNIRIGGGPFEETDLVNMLSKKALALRSLYLVGTKEDRRKCAILYVLSDRIESLMLVVTSGNNTVVRSNRNVVQVRSSFVDSDHDDEDDDDLQEISRAVRRMSKLKRLTILPMLHRECTFNIRSESLEYVQILSSGREGFLIKQCICPSLKLYEGRGCDLDKNVVAGLMLLDSLEEEELNSATRSEALSENSDIGGGNGTKVPHIDFLVSARPFAGLQVPKTCIIRLICRA